MEAKLSNPWNGSNNRADFAQSKNEQNQAKKKQAKNTDKVLQYRG